MVVRSSDDDRHIRLFWELLQAVKPCEFVAPLLSLFVAV
jgi:hypothetical protein